MAEKQLATILDYKRVFNTEQGKRVLHDMAMKFNMLKTTHVKGDPYESKLLEGQRNVMLFIFEMLNTDTKALEQFIAEAKDHAE